MTVWIYSGDRPSNGAKDLAKVTGFKRLRTGNFLKNQDLIVNWGTSGHHMFQTHKQLNHPTAVKAASNKLDAFNMMQTFSVQTVPWCLPTDTPTLASWNAHGTIVGRTKLTGHSGDGIILIGKNEPLQPALLYTRYIPKVREFRVHVVSGKVIDTQQKIRDPNRVPTSWKVRSHENGFIFARNNVPASAGRDTLAIASCAAIGLDFGAVDIVEDKNGSFYVLEVNSAPGLEGQTIVKYAEAFRAV